MTGNSSENLRRLPAVERVLNHAEVTVLSAQHGRAVVTAWIRDTLARMRNGSADKLQGDSERVMAEVVAQLIATADRSGSQKLRRVINGTGIVIHTNLGRAPVAQAAVEAVTAAAAATNLEVDLQTGERGRRGAAVESLCCEVTGAAAALVVNNCAAATLLALQTVGAGRSVVISRGQLIEIGGAFRLPDVFKQAGVILHEVGTTNRTRLADYERAIGPETAAVLRVHPSNYRITGFSESVAIDELAALAESRQLTMIDDVGSGCLYDLSRFGLSDEPVIADSIRAGADLVLFSGDKLLGGPQCGIILGRANLVDKLRANPLARALRVDKLTLAALQATLEIHRAGRAFQEIPVLRQLSMTADEIRERAERLMEELVTLSPTAARTFSIQEVESAPGGGALAGSTLPSWAIAIAAERTDQIAERLRMGTPSVMARIQEGRILVDIRTVLIEDKEPLLRRLAESVEFESS